MAWVRFTARGNDSLRGTAGCFRASGYGPQVKGEVNRDSRVSIKYYMTLQVYEKIMELTIMRSRHSRVVVYIGISAAMLLGALFLLLLNLATSMNHQEAEKRVRLCMQRALSQHHVEMLKEKGLPAPDVAMALAWQEELKQANKVRIVSMEIRRPFLDILLSETPTHVVRVVIDGESQQRNTRYFWLGWDGIDREISRFAWLVSI